MWLDGIYLAEPFLVRHGCIFAQPGFCFETAVAQTLPAGEDARHLVVRNLQAVLAPSWSMHFGVATGRYAFVWSMGGENQEFEDMQAVDVGALR